MHLLTKMMKQNLNGSLKRQQSIFTATVGSFKLPLNSDFFYFLSSSHPLYISDNGLKISPTAEEGIDRWNKGNMYYTGGISDETQLVKLMLNCKFGIWKLFHEMQRL